MAMESEPIEPDGRRYGDDTPPLFSSVRDQPYSNGCITSQARTMSPQYVEFLKRNRDAAKGGD